LPSSLKSRSRPGKKPAQEEQEEIKMVDAALLRNYPHGAYYLVEEKGTGSA
jgi:hypothetical protein